MIFVIGGSGFIGSHLTQLFLTSNLEFRILDTREPAASVLKDNWIYCDILNEPQFREIVLYFEPTVVINLAATTLLWSEDKRVYEVNTDALRMICKVLEETKSLKIFISTSTQHVTAPGNVHSLCVGGNNPYADYGRSKAEGEIIVSSSKLRHWVIVRPTNVWGPGSYVLKDGLARQIISGYYFHPLNDKVCRAYSYVGNLAHQYLSIILQNPEVTHSKIYYLADGNLLQRDWVTELSYKISGKPMKTLPSPFLYGVALFGNFLHLFGVNFPLDIPRFRNMTVSNEVPLDETFRDFGLPRFSLQEAMQETAKWILLENANAKKNY